MTAPSALHLLALFSAHSQISTVAQAATITGFVVDNYCWDRPNHIGIDGSNLEMTPEDHILHCLTFSVCIPGGYAILEQYLDEGQTKYRPRYQLDTKGNELVVELVGKELSKNGDRKFTEQVEVEGDVVDAAENSAHRNGLTVPGSGQQILVVQRIRSVHSDASKVVEVGAAEDTVTSTQAVLSTTSSTTRTQAYNCYTKELWTDDKTNWCCEYMELGCPKPPVADERANCTLGCGTSVQHGWTGQDEGSNGCNNCGCSDGMLACTLKGCLDEPPCPEEVCTVAIAEANMQCPVARCAMPDCPDGYVEKKELMEARDLCCLKLCNFECMEVGSSSKKPAKKKRTKKRMATSRKTGRTRKSSNKRKTKRKRSNAKPKRKSKK